MIAAMAMAMATTRRADMFTADGKPSDDDPHSGMTIVMPCSRRAASMFGTLGWPESG
jgi:hypothetical protein